MDANASRITGEVLRELREVAGLTQSQVGELLGVYQSRISNIENGERTLHAHEIPEYAKALGVSSYDLLSAIETALS
ncbi:MAG: helix-turn-helix transcriptional regulator [Eggerthellaceae bacterium]|nr:helix-turn-helix transcriptional regulator [Eggerthellaceae bacterium]